MPSNSHSITAAKAVQQKSKMIGQVKEAEPHDLEQVCMYSMCLGLRQGCIEVRVCVCVM